MTRSLVPGSLALVLVLGGCGGSAPEPGSPETVPTPDEAPARAADAPAADAPASSDGWEGEAEAKSGESSEQVPRKAADSGVAETRTMELIAKIVRDARQPVRDCYDQARKEIPSLKGDMVISFDLDPEGKVKKAELNQQRSTLKSPAVVECAIKTIRGLSFPPSSRGMETSVNYPYNFNP
jgi:TonB family protein